MSLGAGKVTLNGDTSGAADEFAGTVNCGYSTVTFFKGPQHYYKVALAAGDTIKLSYAPSFYSYLYVFPETACGSATAINAACASGSSAGLYEYVSSSTPESVYFTAPAAGTYVVAVDSTGTTSSYYGTYQLDIERFTPASNDTCAAAQALAFDVSGKATATGDTTGTANEYGALITCGGSSALDGPQLYYAVDLKAGQTYKLTLDPDFIAYAYIFPQSACGASGSIDLACGSGGTSGVVVGSVSSTSTGSVYFTPSAAGKYLIAVDSTGTTSSYYGTFQVDIEESSAPQNGTCAKAEAVTLSSGKATVNGDTTGIPDEYSTMKCTSATLFDGSQLYYNVTLQTGMGYRFTLKPTFYAYLYIFPANACGSVANMTAGCASGGVTGDVLSSSVSSGSSGTLTFTPASGGDYVFAVDATAMTSSYYGTFSVDVEEFTPPTNGKCAGAQAVSVPSTGKITLTGDTRQSANEYGTSVNCGTSSNFDGQQLYYKVALNAGDTLKAYYAPSFYSYLYIFPEADCGNTTQLNTDCGSAGANGLYEYVSSSTPESVYFKAPTTGNYIVVVDSTDVTSSYSGSFTLDLSLFTVASNATCAAAEAVTFTSGKATLTGDTTGTADEYGGAVNCGYSSNFDGPQVYYKVSLGAGETLKMRYAPSFYSYLYVFPSSACGSATTINAACASASTSGLYEYVSYTTPETLYFTAPAADDYLIALDSTGTTSSYYGGFQLDLEQFTPATNATCATAQTLTLASGTASATGNTAGTADEYSTLTCGGSTAFDGPQVYYKVNLGAGKTYNITLSPAFSAYLYVFDATACGASGSVDLSCGSAGTSGDVTSAISSGGSGTIKFSPSTTGDYIIGVDSSAPTSFGDFTLKVSEYNVPTFTAPVSWDFETSCQGLAATLDWECGTYVPFTSGTNCDSTVRAPTAAHSGTGMWGTKLNDCYSPSGNNSASCANANTTDDSTLAFKVALPGGWTSASMSYWSFDEYFTSFDWAEIRINGAVVWQNCATYTNTWTQRTVDLSAYVGQTVTIEFYFMASTVINYAGWYIDDLVISGS